MKTGIILYQSKYGATERYAQWLSEELGFDCIPTKHVKVDQILQYDTVVLGGGIYASGILGLSFLKKNYSAIRDKKTAVFCVGASPYEEAAFRQIVEHNMKEELKGVPCFYCRGAWNEEKMTFGDRALCRMLQKAVSKKDPSTYKAWEKALMCAVGKNCDWTDRKYLRPIIDFING